MLTQEQKARKVKTAEADVTAADKRLTTAKDRLAAFDKRTAEQRAELAEKVTTATATRDGALRTLDWLKEAPVIDAPAADATEDAEPVAAAG